MMETVADQTRTTSINYLHAAFPGIERWEDRGNGLWRGPERFVGWRYVLFVEEPGRPPSVSTLATEDIDHVPGVEAHLRRTLDREVAHHRLPVCVVPGCGEKAPIEVVAAESGRLAGQLWRSGDKIRLCPQHFQDILHAQTVQGRDQLAGWLQPDARPSALDEFDAETDRISLPPDWLDRQARIVRVRREVSTGGTA